MIKELEMGSLAWIFWMGPRCHQEDLYKKETRRFDTKGGGDVMTKTELKLPDTADPA